MGAVFTRILVCSLPSILEDTAMVSDLLDHVSFTWRKELICSIFSPREAKAICQIPLSRGRGTDLLVWPANKNGIFSQQVPLKVKHFIRRACRNLLPTDSKLVRRGVEVEYWCSHCGEGVQTTEHVLLEYQIAKDVWLLSPLRLRDQVVGDDVLTWFWAKVQHLESTQIELTMMLAWALWRARNVFIFENSSMLAAAIVQLALSTIIEYQGAQEKGIEGTPMPRVSSWSPPGLGVVKVNTDAAVRECVAVGLAMVVRNEAGEVMAAGMRSIQYNLSPEEAEMEAAIFAVSRAAELGFSHIVLETDCIALV
ncbi:uncharacterized protein LOC105630371 [Jatropha curcas]|uniref:uncharacterized protein LOC105630371 n=1 Tax=Jatropha curcas TaxID=180498 RepID=UPI0005FB7EC3|nr:uncharacterized protein LOC105630371 [Jatropha curcas]